MPGHLSAKRRLRSRIEQRCAAGLERPRHSVALVFFPFRTIIGRTWEDENDNEDDKEPAKRNGRRDGSLISRNFREIWGWGREIKKRNLGGKKKETLTWR